MDSDTSIASMTTARLRGTFTSWVGPATATVSSATPISSSAAGMCRVARGRFGATLSSRSNEANRSVYRCRRRLDHDVPGGQQQDGDAADEQPDRVGERHRTLTRPPPRARPVGPDGPVAVAPVHPRLRLITKRSTSAIQSRSVRRVSSRRTGAAQRQRDLLAVLRGAGRVALAQRRGGLDLAGAATLRVHQGRHPDVGQRDVQRVEHLDAHQVVPGGQCAQRPLPVDRPDEVGDDRRPGRVAAAAGGAARSPTSGRRARRPRRVVRGPACGAGTGHAAGRRGPEPVETRCRPR